MTRSFAALLEAALPPPWGAQAAPAAEAGLLPAPRVLALTGDGETAITAPVEEHAAAVQPGGVFVARPGLAADGHDYIAQALARGAAAIVGERPRAAIPALAERPHVPYAQIGGVHAIPGVVASPAAEAVGWLASACYGHPSRDLAVIGITGTDGKTTTSTLLHGILDTLTGGRAGLISTVAAYIGAQVIDTGLHVTTPGAPQLHALLRHMREAGMEIAVIEATSHGLAQGRLNGVIFDLAVLTNLTHEHLDFHGSFEAYRAAKARLFAMMAARPRKQLAYFGQHGPGGGAVLPWQDEHTAYFARLLEACGTEIAFHGIGYPDAPDLTYAHYTAERMQHAPDALSFELMRLEAGMGYHRLASVRSPLVGAFNVRNITAAAAAAHRLNDDGPLFHGRTTEALAEGIARVGGVPGRMQRIDAGQPYLAIVDFAHTPNALANALDAARAMAQANGGRVLCAFGCAGLRDRDKRRLMPQAAIARADLCAFTAEDPRTEALDAILAVMAEAAAAAGGVEGETFVRIPDRGEALRYLCSAALAGDVVIACGKGHEQSMAFGETEYPWDDAAALRAAIAGRALGGLPTSGR
jgi:UDP-N-acetylmuramoyl-L-alanyl-D-glutamate--2,6-diaminopimelate ligase